jgi:hypothetical protein
MGRGCSRGAICAALLPTQSQREQTTFRRNAAVKNREAQQPNVKTMFVPEALVIRRAAVGAASACNCIGSYTRWGHRLTLPNAARPMLVFLMTNICFERMMR